ncbi:MAG TPA: lysozyme inhibitor LprI family protein [Sphingomonas sp.]|nr:lysozyme inhibitor LprI family protein [Sphingomonas sp.]
MLMAVAQSQTQPDCKAPVDQVSMTECAAADFRRADAELNRVWAKAMAWAREGDADLTNAAIDSGPKTAAMLLNAQKAWLAYRDAQCTTEGLVFRGGTIQSSAIFDCKTRLTETRTKELHNLFEGNDVP